MHQVEVDEEIFQFVKAHAEPLVDTFSSALRRLLPLSEKRGPGPTSFRGEGTPEPAGILPLLPNRVPQALRQILEVVHLVLSGPYNRSSATHYVARHHKVAPQTIIDKYTRQLNSTAGEFDQLLEQSGLADLRKILKSKFSEYSQLIDEVITRCLKESGKAQ
jgi:negative regulator of replication initiation